MISYTFVDGFTKRARHRAIEDMKHAIATADGVIVDFAFFGGEAIRLTVELDAAGLTTLTTLLEANDIELFSSCRAELAKAKAMTSSHPITAMLHITFVPHEVDQQPLSAAL